MFVLRADKNKLEVLEREPITSGSVNVYPVRFEFSPDWDGLARTAVFRAGSVSRSVLPDASGMCEIPWEVMEKHGVKLEAGVYGTLRGETVLPTIWASLGTVLEGTTTGEEARPPTPGPYDQILGELEDIRETVENLVITGGGVTDHRLLSNLDVPDQHPITAITRLDRELNKRVSMGDELSIVDIIKIMEG